MFSAGVKLTPRNLRVVSCKVRGSYFCIVLGSVLVLRCAPKTSGADEISFSDRNETVTISCPKEVEIAVLVDYVGRSLGVRFVYGDELKNKRVELRPSPVEVPKSRLFELLVGILRVRDLIAIEQEAGLFRIVATDRATRGVAQVLSGAETRDPNSFRVVSQILPVPSAQVETLADKLGQFLSSPKGSLIAIPQHGMLIVTDYESRIQVVRRLVEILTIEEEPLSVETIEVANGSSVAIGDQVAAMAADLHRARQLTSPPPSVRGDLLSGAIVVIGTAAQITEVRGMIEQLAPATVALTTKVYEPTYLSADRAKSLIDHVVLAPGSGRSRPIDIYVDKEGGRLIVTSEQATHDAIVALLREEDKQVASASRPLRIYPIRNRNAAELLSTISQLLGSSEISVERNSRARTSASKSNAISRKPKQNGDEQSNNPIPRPSFRVQGADYVLTEDTHTNSILAIGTREFHGQLTSLLEDLDRRRPQVLIEMMLIAVTLSDSMDLGVELALEDMSGAWDFLIFSNFGLSSIDVATGERTLNPGLGANGILMSPTEVPVIIQALANRGIAKVISTPKLLVSDNARGVLRNVEEAPFTSVNASDTVATTSFAGFESAGTTLSVTPHIAEGDHLTLDFELSFSNFTGGSSSAAIPPPRTTNSFSSTVEVPDGYTVITGGLVVDSQSDAQSEVPGMGRVPIIGKLFQSSSKQNTKTKIFAFIRPLILRNDEFEDLRDVTIDEKIIAEFFEGKSPLGKPMWME